MSEKAEIKQRYDNFADHFNRVAGKKSDFYSNISGTMRYYRERKIEAAISLGEFKKGMTILEVGANMGQYTTLLAEKGFSMVGTDLSDKAIEVARAAAKELSLKNVEYYPADVENMGIFKDGTFDGAVSFSTLRYVPDLKKALKEICRITKKGGVVALDFPNRSCPWFRILKNRFGVENHIHDHFYSAKELRRLFEEAGFTGIETRKVLFTHYTFPANFLSLYKTIDFIGERIFFIKELAGIIFCKGVKA